jgi:dTDP-4-amino-4,6-dideoxygalactose transaminase
MPYNVTKLDLLGQKYDIPIIEDSAEALGSKVKNKACGTFGSYGILSFNGNKIITTSGGGALITKTKKQKRKAIFLATQAREDAPHYQHSEIGYNYRMSNIVAGIGKGQLEVINDRVEARRTNFERYKKELSPLGYEFLEEPKDYLSNRWLTCMLTPSFEHREKLRLALEKEHIESRPLWKPMHMQPVFKNNISFVNGNSEQLFEKGLCLPSGSSLTKTDLDRIFGVLKKF